MKAFLTERMSLLILLTFFSLPASAQNLSFTTIDVPGAKVTGISGVNASGDMVGTYGPSTLGPTHSYRYTAGAFKYFDDPGASNTVATGINDAGLIVGYTLTGATERGFLYDGTTFTGFRDGDSTATVALGIDDAGDIVGGDGSIYTTRGFLLRGHRFKDITPPGTYVYVYASGINNFGTVVGWTDNAGFIYRKGTFQTIMYPGSSRTVVTGINDSGVIVGWYVSGGSDFGFFFSAGRFTSFAYPGAVGTFPVGINSAGQVVGGYTFDYTSYHGFVTSPIAELKAWQ